MISLHTIKQKLYDSLYILGYVFVGGALLFMGWAMCWLFAIAGAAAGIQ